LSEVEAPPSPAPTGVPVEMMSPGSSVITDEQYAMISGMR